MSSFILSGQGLVVVTNDDGTVSVVPGFPVSTTPLDQALLAGLVTDADSLLAPAVAGGAVSLTAALVADADAIYAPVVAPGAVTLTGALITDSDTFYAPDIGAPPQTLTAALYTDSDTFYAPGTTFILDAWGFIDEAAFVVEFIYDPSIAQVVLPAPLADGDAIYAPVVTLPALQTLLPGPIADADAISRPLVDVVAPPVHGSTKHVRPNAVSDADSIKAAAIGTNIKPNLIAADDSIYAIPSITAARRPALVPADDAVYPLVVTLFVQAAFVPDDGAIPAADVGWHLFVDAPVTDVDACYGAHAEAWAYVVPDVFADEESVDTYPFKVQSITGGIPAPPPLDVLTGSLRRPRTLTGSMTSRRVLTGSFANKTRRVLTGSHRRGLHSGKR